MPNFIQGAVFFFALLGASVCDIWSRHIPPAFPIMIAIAGLTTVSPASLLGLLLALPFFIAARHDERSMGGGDIKLVAASSFLLGLPAGTLGLVIGLTAQLLVCGATRLFRFQHSRAYPLAPCLSFGFFTAFIISGGIT